MQMMMTQSVRGTPFKAPGSMHTKPVARRALVVRATSDPLLQKPAAKPAAPAAPAPAVEAAAPAAAAPAASAATSGVTMEYQRQQAKAMQQYFKSLKYEQTVEQGKVFGWTKKNEINNGRWVMTGLAVGLLTEYATGVDFIDQLKMMGSYLGLVDLD